MKQITEAQPGRAVRISEVCRLTGVSRATVWRLVKLDPAFPRPFKVSAAITAWDEKDVFAWLAAKKHVRTQAAA